MSRVIALTGVPGIGKTYLLSQPQVRLAIEEDEYEIVGMGDIIFEVAKQYGIMDRDELRNLPLDKQIELQYQACEYIQEEYVESGINLIVDTHASILTPNGFMATFNEWVEDAIDLNYIIVLEANPEDIRNRRMRDTTRRRFANIEEIELHQNFNRSVVAAYVTYSTTIAKIINNSDGNTENAVNELIRLLEVPKDDDYEDGEEQ